MLDECKGDKFEEVLASFSTVVLQKVLAAESNENPSVVKRLALARKVPSKDQESLLPLAVAHRASLTAVLRRKAVLKTRYTEFQRLLDEKERELAQRTEHLGAIEESGAAKFVPNHAIQGIKRQFDVHWQGDIRWVDVIVKGGEHDTCDSLFETEFSELWPSLNEGTLHETTVINQHGLFQDLEKTIANQQARLQHWKAAKDDLISTPKLTAPTKISCLDPSKSHGIELDLSRHKDISFDPRKPLGREKAQAMADKSSAPSMIDEYARLVDSMQAELATVGKGRRQGVKSSKRDRNSIFPVPLGGRDIAIESDRPQSPGRESGGNFDSAVVKNPWPTSRPSMNLPSAQWDGGDAYTSHISTGDLSNSLHESTEIAELKEKDAGTLDNGPESDTKTVPETEEAHIELEVLGEDEVLVQQIISSTRNATPSPARPKRSLVERTRQSMGFSSLEALNKFPNSEATALPPPTSSNIVDSSPSLSAKSKTLLERTRQSMSLMPSNSLEPRKSVYRSRHSKAYPTNQFETPNKQQTTTNFIEDTTPPEKLFTQEADYASVFKSRPKIALSPTVSPELRELNETDEFDENSSEDDALGHGGGSPSIKRMGKVGRF